MSGRNRLVLEIVQIGVFSLFNATELRVSPVSTALLITSNDSRIVLEGRQSRTISLARISGRVKVSSLDGSDANFRISIPGKIERQFHGTLTIQAGDHKLIPVVAMDREIAVASVVAAEMPRGTPVEALKAQAVIARAYFAAAGPRHDAFDFCDTTHCQFLREPPEPGTDAFLAANETHGLILAYHGKPLAALYSASCGGQTRSLDAAEPEYQYRSVPCDFCRRNAPGLVQGHQLGLCQKGAAGMAAAGAGFREILEHYYPGTFFLLPPSPALSHSKD
jgi:peptidoglycan hydrolase-like amidase